MKFVIFATAFLFVFSELILAKQEAVNADVVISNVDQAVDLTTHLPKIVSSITFKNNGKSPVQSVLFAVTPSLASKLAFIEATAKGSEEDEKLAVVETSINQAKSGKFFLITLADSLAPGREVELDVETVYPHTLEAYPTEITQAEKQFVRFTGNAYFFTPYTSTIQTTKFTLATNAVESYSKTPKPVAQTDNTITYGQYEEVAPFTEVDVAMHFENNRPFLAVTELIRTIEISHWGNIAVEESVDIRHSGASLKGSFSRFDYQRNQDGVSSVKSFKTILPPSARDVYYRDEIGNISTSHLKEGDEFVEVELRPRFPLFGGWKTHYILGYNVPSYQYLYSSGDQFVLKMRMLDHIYDDQVIEYMTLNVILPEGATHIKMVAPFAIEEKN
jgi:oligosaccharyltransferase complex subunit alpha (ribophorin I)